MPPSSGSGVRRPSAPSFVALVLGGAALLYAAMLAFHVGAYAGGSDSSGYLNHARLLASGQIVVAPRAIPQLAPEHTPSYLYSALGFKPAVNQRDLVPTYPPGLSLIIAAAALVFGWELAPHVVAIVHGVAGLLLTYAAAHAFTLSRAWSFVAALVVALSPVYLNMTLQALSDVPALVWTTAAILAAWHSRTRRRWALAAGIAFAVAVLVRPTNFLALPAVAIALGFDWRRWALLAAGGVPGAVFFFLHNRAAYGKFLTTGYGDSAGLEAAIVPATLAHYAIWLPVLFTPVVIGFFALVRHARIAPRASLVLAVWFLIFAAFYAAYPFTHETWWYLRFLLPAAPALVIGGLLGTRALLATRLTPLRSRVLVAFALLVTGGSSAWCAAKLHSLDSGKGEKVYLLTAQWLRENLPPDALVAVMQHSGAVNYYTDFAFIRWDQFDGGQFSPIIAAVQAARRPLYAVLFPFEVADGALEKRMPGRWNKVGSVREVGIWKFEGPATEPSGG